MSRFHTIIKGTAILTFTGLLTRFIGFFYRIFLSRTLGEAGVGTYQLIFPIYALGFSLTSAGTEIALSRMIANLMAIKQKNRVKELFISATIFSLFLSILFTLFLQKYSGIIATGYLHNENTQELLLILSYVFPLSTLHSCIVGYYLGLKQTKIPSLSQIIEQCLRILSVITFYGLSVKCHFQFHISFTVAGIIIGELASSIFCLKMINTDNTSFKSLNYSIGKFIYNTKELLGLSIPITSSRVLLNILQSIEAVSIPLSLVKYGNTTSQALSIYGVLTGMALPCILFPSAITNALSTMLLPTVSEIHAVNDNNLLIQIIKKSIISCTTLGTICCIGFLCLGDFAGNLLFQSSLAGKFIMTLAWICPFLYTNNTLLGIINGIGNPWIAFLINSSALTLRILSIIILIPIYGIYGYLCGLLVSQLSSFSFCILFLYKKFRVEAK